MDVGGCSHFCSFARSLAHSLTFELVSASSPRLCLQETCAYCRGLSCSWCFPCSSLATLHSWRYQPTRNHSCKRRSASCTALAVAPRGSGRRWFPPFLGGTAGVSVFGVSGVYMLREYIIVRAHLRFTMLPRFVFVCFIHAISFNVVNACWFNQNSFQQILLARFLSVFLRVPTELHVDHCMLETANCLVKNLDARLLDEEHSTASLQVVNHYRERIKQFDQKMNNALDSQTETV